MKNLKFGTNKFDNNEVKLFKETIEALGGKFKIQSVNTPNHKGFEIFDQSFVTNIAGTLLINAPLNSHYLVFTRVCGKRMGWSNPALSYNEYQVFAFATLRRDFGRVLIRKRSIIDKIINLFLPVELHFNDDTIFNKKFYVVASEKEKAFSSMTPDFRKVIMELNKDGYVINIINQTLVVEYLQSMNPQQTIKLAELANRLSMIL